PVHEIFVHRYARAWYVPSPERARFSIAGNWAEREERMQPTTQGSNDVGFKRWAQLIMGVICMAMIANLQYGWTFFVNPIVAKFHFSKAAIQTAFTLFVLFETWLVPIEGWLVDKYGPRVVTLVGGILVGIAWVINSMADSLTMFYVGAIIGGIGAGAVYGTSVG